MVKDRKKLRLAHVVIDKFSSEGQGLGTCVNPNGSQSVVEVPFCIPGDETQVSLLKKRKGVFQSRLLEMIKPSTERIEPRCMHFGECGGCRWQQISYEQQLDIKEEWISNAFRPYINAQTVRYPLIPCSPPWHYRNKVELTFSSDKAGNRYLGYIIYASRGRVFNLKECHLVPAWMNAVAQAVQTWWKDTNLDAYRAFRDTGSLRTLTLRTGQRTGDKMIILTVSGNADFALKQQQLNQFVNCIKAAIQEDNSLSKLSIFLRIQQIAKGQRTHFYEMQLAGDDHICEIMHLPDPLLGKNSYIFGISPTAFFQPNTIQAEKLYTRVVEMAQPRVNDLVYDLYCGTGTLGIAFSKFVREVVGIELSPESVLDGRENVKRNQLNNMTLHQGDVAKILPQLLDEKNQSPDLVIVDPPRAGLDPKAIQHLISIQAPKIAYVSCNPITQAANLAQLCEAGYQLDALQPIDQFPQTVHVENIAILTKKTIKHK